MESQRHFFVPAVPLLRGTPELQQALHAVYVSSGALFSKQPTCQIPSFGKTGTADLKADVHGGRMHTKALDCRLTKCSSLNTHPWQCSSFLGFDMVLLVTR